MDSVTPDISAFEALPAESPLFMPEQSFSARPDKEGRPRTPVTEPRTIVLRRLSVLGSALALTVYGAWHMHLVLDANGVTLLGFTMLALFVLLFFWIGLAFTSACAGFFSMLTRGGLGLGLTRSGPLPELQSRTALLLPVYNESPHRVMAGLKAIYSSLKATGQIGAFDLFITHNSFLTNLTDYCTFLKYMRNKIYITISPLKNEPRCRIFYDFLTYSEVVVAWSLNQLDQVPAI